jgi:hypothetical protein
MAEKNEFKKKFNIVITDIKKYFKTIKKVCNKCYNIKNIKLYDKNRGVCKECLKIFRKCIHNTDKNTCKQCGTGGSICKHFKTKQECKECGSTRFCEHNKRKSNCKECNGINICEHSKYKNTCKECGTGGSICEHFKTRSECKDCGSKRFCKHDKVRNNCRDCNGISFCKHDKFRTSCKDCKGGSVCEHNQVRSTCIICTPYTKKYCVNCRSFQVKKSNNYLCSYCNLNKKTIQKNKEIKLKNWLYVFGINIIYNKRQIINNKCIFPDFLINCNTFNIIIECDEHSHKSYKYDEERNRENNIRLALNSPCVFIRYNPDNKKYKESTRMIILKSYIDYYRSLENCENILQFLFYSKNFKK